MKIEFYKYQGTGNDFVIIDNRRLTINKDSTELFKRLCDRRFGVGADGVILLQEHKGYHFEMVYFNADGCESSMCGNGGRCLTAFAKQLGIVNGEATFLAVDGEHYAKISANEVSLKMIDMDRVESGSDFYVLNTGSPHYVKFVKNVQNLDVFNEGRGIRNSDRFKKEGINVNFVEDFGDYLFVRTYERGVENETLSCGTGVTASALSASLAGKAGDWVAVKTPGGNLKVSFNRRSEQSFNEIYLSGPAELVFRGEISV